MVVYYERYFPNKKDGNDDYEERWFKNYLKKCGDFIIIYFFNGKIHMVALTILFWKKKGITIFIKNMVFNGNCQNDGNK